MIFRTRYSESKRRSYTPTGLSKTKQSFKDECNINQIMAKYRKTGLLTHVKDSLPRYGDFANIKDYQSAMNVCIKAQEAFDQLPGHIRKRFNHDPGQFVEFCQNPKNGQELLNLGLADRKRDNRPSAGVSPSSGEGPGQRDQGQAQATSGSNLKTDSVAQK